MEPLLRAPAFDRQSTAEQVAALIRETLLRGEVPPGTKFPEQMLAKTYGVSRNTMREALVLLRGQGLIRHYLHRGAVVAELDDTDIVDVLQARRVLELNAIDIAAAAPPEALEPLREALAEMEGAASIKDFLQADQRFHHCIVDFLGSDRLSSFFEALQTEQALVRAWRGDDTDRQSMCDTHRELLEVIAAGDAAKARELAGAIVDRAQARLRRASVGTLEPLQ